MRKKSIKLIVFIFIIFLKISDESKAQFFIQKLNDLNFGDVFIGYSATVTDVSPNAAKFRFYQNSYRRLNIQLSFNLPTHLTNGKDYLPINFNNLASWSRSDNVTGRTYFNPYSPITISKVRRNRVYYVWLGGQITSQSNVSPGLYTGTIVLIIEVL